MAACLVLAPSLYGDGRSDEALLPLKDAKALLLDLINRDRTALGRKPVLMDVVAEAVAQRQAEEMVRMAAMSHADSGGRLPIQRYTEAGGKNSVHENVVCFNVRTELTQSIEVQAQSAFTRAEIEAVEAAYFNEIAPNDGHRRNILQREHTHVGIGLARGAGDDAPVIANAQEFVDRHAEDFYALPREAAVEETVTVGGRLGPGRRLVAIGLARGPLPRPLDRDAFRAVSHYSVPAPFVKFWADRPEAAVKLNVDADGRFQATVQLDDGGRPGLYYLSVWVADDGRDSVLASVRTVVVKRREKAPRP